MNTRQNFWGREKEYQLLEQLLERLGPDRETMEKLLETAQKQEDPRWTGILMERLGGMGRKREEALTCRKKERIDMEKKIPGKIREFRT